MQNHSPDSDVVERHLRRHYGFRVNVTLRAVRPIQGPEGIPEIFFEEGVLPGPDHLFAGDDTTAPHMSSMHWVYAGRSDPVRGWWACSGGRMAFCWPLERIYHPPPPGVGPLPGLGHIGFELCIGQRFWREHELVFDRPSFMWGEKETLVTFMGFDPEDGNVVLSTICEDPSGMVQQTTELLPINKFLEEYNPNTYCRVKDHRVWRLAMLMGAAPAGGPQPSALPWSFGLATIVKLKRQWRKVHVRAEQKKYAPGGVGHMRAGEEFAAHASASQRPKRPRPSEAQLCMELDSDANGRFGCSLDPRHDVGVDEL